MAAELYRLKCLTNLYVGSGDVNFNVIDQEVEKDISGYPMIHSSGVKGAFRDYFKKIKKSPEEINRIFGKEGSGDDGSTGGEYSFFDARFLARPLRVEACPDRAFIPVTSVSAINEFIEITKAFGCCPEGLKPLSPAFGDKDFLTCMNVSNIEGSDKIGKMDQTAYNAVKKLLCSDFALARDINDYPLPVIARNSLNDNGISKNLWYMEYVPHHSLFWLIVLHQGNNVDLSGIVQFGGNASVGYGFTGIERIKVKVYE